MNADLYTPIYHYATLQTNLMYHELQHLYIPSQGLFLKLLLFNYILYPVELRMVLLLSDQ